MKQQTGYGKVEGAARTGGEPGSRELEPVGSTVIAVLNGSRQVDKVVAGAGKDGQDGWQTQKVLPESGLPKGVYFLSKAADAAKNVHPQSFGSQVLHFDDKNVYQFGKSDGKGKPTLVKHDRKIFDQALGGKDPIVGKCYEVTYSRGVGKVKGEISLEEGMKFQQSRSAKI